MAGNEIMDEIHFINGMELCDIKARDKIQKLENDLALKANKSHTHNNYATSGDLLSKADKYHIHDDRYLIKTDVIDLINNAIAGGNLSGYAKIEDLKNYITKEQFLAQVGDLSKYATQSDLVSIREEIAQRVRQSEMINYVTKAELSGYVRGSELLKYAKLSDLESYVLDSELNEYARKSELDKYALKSDIAFLDDCVTKYLLDQELAKYVTLEEYTNFKEYVYSELAILRAEINTMKNDNEQEGKCSIYYNLSSYITSTNTITTIEKGKPYQTIIKVSGGHWLDVVKVIMNGKDISKSVIEEGFFDQKCTINIPSVTGDISISATHKF